MNSKEFWEAVKELSPKLFKTYSVIYKLSDNKLGYCFASNKLLEEKLGKTNIYRDITLLKKKGYVQSLEVRREKHILERRIYTNANYKGYLEDKKNRVNLLKTYYTENKGIIEYYNEKNPCKKRHCKSILKNDAGYFNKNEESSINKNDEVNIIKNNITKKKTREELINEFLINSNFKTIENLNKTMLNVLNTVLRMSNYKIINSEE